MTHPTILKQAIRQPVARPWIKIGSAIALALTLAACAAGAPNQPDFVRGTWDGQTIVPPAGLLTAYQGDLIGRRVENHIGRPSLTVWATLIDPVTAQPRYVVLAGAPGLSVTIVPVNSLAVTPTSIQMTATDYTLHTLPSFPTLAALETQYPRTVITTPMVVQSAPGPGMLPPVLPPPALGVAAAPLQLVRAGSVVGMPVIDAAGVPIGRVDAVAIVPITGEVRFAIVSGPSLGTGWYIAVPATQAQANAGQVVLTGTLDQWMQAPRYRGDQLPQAIGVVGMLNQ
jgi:hypothetical protein